MLEAPLRQYLARHLASGAAIADESPQMIPDRRAAYRPELLDAVGTEIATGEVAERPMRREILEMGMPSRVRRIPPSDLHQGFADERAGIGAVARRAPREISEAMVAVSLPEPIGGDVGEVAEALLAACQAPLGGDAAPKRAPAESDADAPQQRRREHQTPDHHIASRPGRSAHVRGEIVLEQGHPLVEAVDASQKSAPFRLANRACGARPFGFVAEVVKLRDQLVAFMPILDRFGERSPPGEPAEEAR